MWAIELRHLVNQVRIEEVDCICWKHLSFKEVSISSIWHCLRPPEREPPWVAAVWSPLSIPKCAFTMWLAFKNRLLTKDRMILFGLQTDSRCLLCSNADETAAHLFGECPYSMQITSDIGFGLVNHWPSYLDGCFMVGNNHSRIRKLLAQLFLSIAIFYIWKERNERLHVLGHAI